MIRVRLTQGKFALIDDEFAFLLTLSWYAKRDNGLWYALHNMGKPTWKVFALHRAVLGVTDRRVLIDHRNGDGLDCRLSNLRLVDARQNGMNRRTGVNNTSGFKGVHRATSRRSDGPVRWCAQIRIASRWLHLGTFDRAEDAALAYDEAARIHFGEYAALNFPKEGERAA